MEETLRYFFSAIFQGIAAILTLGSMFYMNYNEKTKARIDELIKRTNELINHGGDYYKNSVSENLIDVMKNRYLEPDSSRETFSEHFYIIEEFEDLTRRQREIGNIIPYLLFKGVILFTLSSVMLFLIGYNEYLNYCVFGVGVYTLFLTYSFIQNLERIILKTSKIDKMSNLKFKNIFKNYNGD